MDSLQGLSRILHRGEVFSDFSPLFYRHIKEENYMDEMSTTAESETTTFDAFLSMTGGNDRIPLVMTMNADGETPMGLYRKLSEKNVDSFLLESCGNGNGNGRYSFIGTDPERIFHITPEGCRLCDGRDKTIRFFPSRHGTEEALREYIGYGKGYPDIDGLPPFTGGLAGYFGYGMIGEWETLFHGTDRKLRPSGDDISILMGFSTVVAVDHETDNIFLIRNVRIPGDTDMDSLKEIYEKGMDALEGLRSKVEGKCPTPYRCDSPFLSQIVAHTPKMDFLKMVEEGRQRIVAGDICQVVLSQRFSAETDLPSMDIYDALKEGNPSPYLFYVNLGKLELIGSSPEVLVKVQRGHVTTRPLAGTRPRGSSAGEDEKLSCELLSDDKERAEHIMLVDLARNDLGRVCKTGTVSVTELMGLEHYSRVMHIVSQVEGEMEDGLTAMDVLESAFPAGTVSGAPKIRAMEIIEELEPYPRGPYAGAVGYIGFGGNMDTCITLRTMVRKGNSVSVQAGAGIVYDSVPEKEYDETRNKAKALLDALENAMERRISQ